MPKDIFKELEQRYKILLPVKRISKNIYQQFIFHFVDKWLGLLVYRKLNQINTVPNRLYDLQLANTLSSNSTLKGS